MLAKRKSSVVLYMYHRTDGRHETLEEITFNFCECTVDKFFAGDDIGALLKRVDNALYAAKERGKICVPIKWRCRIFTGMHMF